MIADVKGEGENVEVLENVLNDTFVDTEGVVLVDVEGAVPRPVQLTVMVAEQVRYVYIFLLWGLQGWLWWWGGGGRGDAEPWMGEGERLTACAEVSDNVDEPECCRLRFDFSAGARLTDAISRVGGEFGAWCCASEPSFETAGALLGVRSSRGMDTAKFDALCSAVALARTEKGCGAFRCR